MRQIDVQLRWLHSTAAFVEVRPDRVRPRMFIFQPGANPIDLFIPDQNDEAAGSLSYIPTAVALSSPPVKLGHSTSASFEHECNDSLVTCCREIEIPGLFADDSGPMDDDEYQLASLYTIRKTLTI